MREWTKFISELGEFGRWDDDSDDEAGLSGAIVSLIFLFLCQFLSHKFFSIYTFSMLMGLGHILGQFTIVRIFIIPDDGVYILFPLFLLLTFIFSLINAFIVSKLISPSN